MAQPWEAIARTKQPVRGGIPSVREPGASRHFVLCVLPRRVPSNPLKSLLKGYELAVADSWRGALRLARAKAYDLYVVYSPLLWAEPIEICGRIRTFDKRTPVILYSSVASAAERREALAGGAIQAYVARSDDVHNLSGTAGQLIMLAELRSIEAMRSGEAAMQQHIIRRVTRLRGRSPEGALELRAQTRLKLDACRLFASAGGSRANFERLWPAIYEAAMKQLGQPPG